MALDNGATGRGSLGDLLGGELYHRGKYGELRARPARLGVLNESLARSAFE